MISSRASFVCAGARPAWRLHYNLAFGTVHFDMLQYIAQAPHGAFDAVTHMRPRRLCYRSGGACSARHLLSARFRCAAGGAGDDDDAGAARAPSRRLDGGGFGEARRRDDGIVSRYGNIVAKIRRRLR
uniref:Uncharacterized protein n=1 Tax=mine drainage metagenome TaxID=410659 RepID=E6PIK9_9ZZZZ